jgi:hypothetical protein
VDNSGIVRIHDPSKSIQFKKECAGNAKKALKLNNAKDKLYFIWAQDRSVIIEQDLKSMDYKSREIKFKYGKIIDLEILNDRQLVILTKDGWVEFRDLKKRDIMPGAIKISSKQDKKPLGGSDDESPSKKLAKPDEPSVKKQMKADDGTPIMDDLIFQLALSNTC